MTLGQQLRQKRHEAHLSQIKVAESLHLSRQAISRWENDQSTPDLSSLQALGHLYKCSPTDLINDLSQQTIATSAKDEGLLLLILTGITFLLAPLGLVMEPLIFHRNQKANTYYHLIQVMSVGAILVNLFLLIGIIADLFNWGVTSYH